MTAVLKAWRDAYLFPEEELNSFLDCILDIPSKGGKIEAFTLIANSPVRFRECPPDNMDTT